MKFISTVYYKVLFFYCRNSCRQKEWLGQIFARPFLNAVSAMCRERLLKMSLTTKDVTAQLHFYIGSCSRWIHWSGF